jgi:hypothetical protein
MKLEKLTTLLVVDAIESCLPAWERLGYSIAVRVPDTGALGFVILKSAHGELMLQTRTSLAEDLPVVAKLEPAYVLYGDVKSLARAKRALPDARVLVDERKTFYGAKEAWLQIQGGTVLGLAEHE